jgi:hypothetical protein
MNFQNIKRSVFVACAVALLASAALSPASALARGGANSSGGKGGKQPPPPASTAIVTLVSANPVPVGTAPTFHATGYKPGDPVYMVMSGYIRADLVYADSTGSLTYTFREPMYSPGGYTFTTTLLNGVNKASVSFSVR